MTTTDRKTFHYSRRSFLGTAASSAFAFNFFPSRVFGANNRLQVAGIGVGGKGKSDFDHLAAHGDVVAACDIDSRRLDVALRKHTDAVKFSDYRELINQLGDKIDALTISTPDHTHAPAAMLAMQKGIHVYVQKPLTHTIWEARQLKNLANENGICTQMGNQGTAENGLREGAEYIRAGGLGKVKEIHAWTNRPVWPQAPDITARPSEEEAIPSHVDWESFIGPAPMRPYNSCYAPFKWRGWWDFGTGALGDMACHTTNLAFMGCELTPPSKAESVNTGPINDETYPSWATIDFVFPKTSKRGPIKFHWYEGKVGNDGKDNKGVKNLPPIDLLHGQKPKGSGLLIVGSDAIMYSPNDYGADWLIYQDGKWLSRKEVELPSQTIPRNGRGDAGMKEEWVKAIRENKPEIAVSNFNYASILTESFLLGNVAMRAGGKFNWNSKKLTTNREDANRLVSKAYRNQWSFEPV